MADYYAVLKRTLSGFGEPSESLRLKIYDKARATISRQLDATQPPLAEETKAAQLQQLDEAIARMEAEYAPAPDGFVGDPPPLPVSTVEAPSEPAIEEPSAPAPDAGPPSATEEPITPPPVEPSEVPAEIVPAEPPFVEPVSVEPTPIESASFEQEPVPAGPTFDPAPSDGVAPADPVVGPAYADPAAAAQASPDPIAEAFAAIEAAREELPPSDPAVFDDAAFDAAARNEAARLDADDGSVNAPAVAIGAAGARAASDAFDDPHANERDAAALAPEPVDVRRPEKKRGRGVLWFLLLVALAGLLFVFRAPLLAAVGVEQNSIDRFVASIPGIGPALVGDVEDPNDPTRPKPVPTIRITPEPEEPVADDDTKREERLGTDGREVEETPAAPDLPAPTIPAIEQNRTEPETSSELVPITPAAPAPETAPSDAPDAPAPATEEADGPAEPVAPADAPVAVAQSAILYEEGSGTRETRSDRGAVVWSVVQQSPGNGEPAEPAIRAVLDVPERALKATITLRRNTDLALAASHLMEVNFEPAAGFSGQNIDELLSVRMKPAEVGQGTPLAVVPAKIAPGYFYVALDNLPSARDRNLELLRTSKWIDIPVEYVTGRRALVSLEKGVVGERVFAEALAAWDAAAR